VMKGRADRHLREPAWSKPGDGPKEDFWMAASGASNCPSRTPLGSQIPWRTK
jgi:hypothetical protein